MPDNMMWRSYLFRGLDVVVIQQWTDPFGRNMLRIRATAPGDDREDGLPEAQFLQEAVARDTIGGNAFDE
jgi:hypothetical protein